MPLSTFQVVPVVKAALHEDLGQGDATTDPLFDMLCQQQVTAQIRTRQDCVVSGVEVIQTVFQLTDASLQIQLHAYPGQGLEAGESLATLTGRPPGILKGERVALNFLQHLCGVATLTRQYVEALAGTKAKITHTRKTTPGLRLLERQAVLDAGGSAHRFNLGQAAMLKDNHVALTGGSLPEAIQRIRQALPHTNRIEIEADDLAGVEQALAVDADIILLDNMTLEQLREAVELIDGKAVTEASGGITLETVRAIAETGVDFISTSQITLGAPAVDIGLDMKDICS